MPTFREAIARLTAEGAPFEIATETVGGVEMQVYRNRSANLRDLFLASAGFGDRVAYVRGGERMTYADLHARARGVAAGLAASGVGPGDRVALLAANAPDWLVTFWATLLLGAVSVPLNAWWKTEELAFVIGDCGARVVVCDARRGTLVAGLDHEIATLARVVRFGDEFEALAATSVATGPDARVPRIGEDDVAVLLYTSGTTGKPKGSIQTHRSTIANFMNLSVRTLASTISAGDKGGSDTSKASPRGVAQTAWLLVVPLFHVTGLFTCAVPQIVIGGKIVFMPPGRFDADVAMAAIEDEEVTILSGVPTIMQRILASPNLGRWDMRTVAQVSYGGAPSPAGLRTELARQLPWLSGGGPLTAYGLTETAGVVSVNSGVDYEAKPDSVGPPVPTVEVRVVGRGGDDVATGERGEIWVKGPIVSPGYWNRPEADAETFTDGWLHTGDVGKLDADGFVYVLDRAKDVIIRGGENVYCAEVEEVLSRHTGVVEAAVVGVADTDLGEKVKAVVVPRRGARLDADSVRAFCREHLADYKVPEIVEVTADPLPRNPSGKVLKSVLRGHDHAFVDDDPGDAVL
ncbi:MAG: AMP-binding protein [Acidimicrobiia bacterium]